MKRSQKKNYARVTREKEWQDAHNIKRNNSKKKFYIPMKTYKIIKICLIAAFPIAYFICSPLLIVVATLYIGLIFITNTMEKNYNDGMRKDQCIQLTKIDSFLCIVLVAITIVCSSISYFSKIQSSSAFEGMNQTQVEQMKSQYGNSNIALRKLGYTLKDASTMMTGTRYLFVPEGTFSHGSNASLPGTPESDGFIPPKDGSGNSSNKLNNMLGDMPFYLILESIVKAVNTGMIVIICSFGVYSIIRLKKIDNRYGSSGVRKTRKT